MRPKIIFWGSPDFSVSAYEACREHGEVLGVVTQPDKERGRGHEVLPTPVKAAALKDGLPVFSPKSLRKVDQETEALLAFLKNNPADFFVVVAYGNLLPDAVLNLPLKACVNIHASLLPRWRGAAPIQRALEAGDIETGVCLQKMVKQLDAGDVYLEKKYLISEDDTSALLFERLAVLGAELISDFLKTPFDTLVPHKQDEALVTLAAKIDKSEAYFRKEWSSQQIHNRVRAFNVWPTVKLVFNNDQNKKIEIKVLEAKLSKNADGIGLFFEKNQKIYLRGSDGLCAELLSLQIPGKAPQPAFVVYQSLVNQGFVLSS